MNKSIYIKELDADIDAGMAENITALNKNGFRTLFSCSGLQEDHPDTPDYRPMEGEILFPLNLEREKINRIKESADKCGLNIEEKTGILKPCLRVYLETSCKDGAKADEVWQKTVNMVRELMDKGLDPIIELPDGSTTIKPEIIQIAAENHGGFIRISDEEKNKIWKAFIKSILQYCL